MVAPQGPRHQLWTQQTALGHGPTSPCRLRRTTSPGCALQDLTHVPARLFVDCPHHAAQRHMRRLHQHLGTRPSNCSVVSIGQTGTTLTRPDPSGELRQRFHEHVCRVSGAQFLTRLGYNKGTVQLIGRWGSERRSRATHRRPIIATSGEGLHQQIEDVVKRQSTLLHNTFWVVNTGSNKAHLPATDEDCINSAMWATQRGWRYATGRYKKLRTQPATNLCGSCVSSSPHRRTSTTG